MPPPESHGDVVGMPWREFLAYFRKAWKPGQHIALIGRTGMGKSTFACGILEHRKYVLALDAKGGDETLETLGYRRISHWPLPAKVWDEIAEGKPARFIVGVRAHTSADMRRNADLLREAVDDAFGLGGWTVYADEFQLLSDRRMMNVGSEIETLLVAARSKKSSVVTSYQAPAWVPRAASRQATWVAIWPTRDKDVAKSLSEIVGRDRRLLWEAMEALPEYHVLVIGPRVRDPMIITQAPERS